MLKISQTQSQALAQQAHEYFIADMVEHLHRYFPEVAQLLTTDELRNHVINSIVRAAQYKITSQQQVSRFLNLTASCGWNFDSNPDLWWMHNILTDTSLAHPGQRLDHLIQTYLHRQGIEEHNQAIHKQLGLDPTKAVINKGSAEDYPYPNCTAT